MATPLTIDTRRLGDLFLPSFERDVAAVEELERLYKRAFARWHDADMQGKPDAARLRVRFDALNRAHTICRAEMDSTVETIRDRGGLLLCVVH